MGETCENRILARNSENHLVLQISLKNAYSVFIALLPVIMIYKVPVVNMGFSTVFLGLFLPYAFVKISKKINFKAVVFVILIWIGYMFVRSSGNNQQIFLLFVILFHILAAFNSSINYPVLRRTMEFIGVLCTGLVVIQTLAHYLLDFNITWLIKPLILEENQHSLEIGAGMYRPSAIFLEPSHYAQYCSLAVLSVLFPVENSKANLKKALWIAFGCLLTTSGMGIALLVGIFGWYALFNSEKKGRKLLEVFGWIIAGAVAYFILIQFTFFSNAINRIFGEVDGYNAIWGRTLYWSNTVGSMSGSDLVWGYGTLDLPEIYMTGLMSIIYQYGIVGLVLMIVTFISLMIYSKNNYSVCCCVIFLAQLPVANLTGFISVIFRITVIVSSAEYSKNKG